MNVLVGKVIRNVHLAEDKLALRFDVEGGEPIIARADGDCCSQSWIENVENPAALIGTPVLAVESLDLPDARTDNDDDVVAFYGLKIQTTKGDCVIDFRNSSNGYYGGNLAWSGDDFYGGVYGQNVSKEVWRSLTDEVTP